VVAAAVIAASRRESDTLAGVAAMAPFVVAYAPFAVVIGSTIATIDDPLAGWSGSWLIYGGSAQLAALHGLAGGSAVLAVVTALVVQTRLLVYGASLAGRWRAQPPWFRLVAPALLIDPTWALADRDSERSPAGERRFFLAAGLTLGCGWSAMMGAGVLLGNRLPDIGLELAAPLCLAALVGARLRDRQHRWAAVIAAAVVLVAPAWPAGTATIVAIVAGAMAARLVASEPVS
jgi:predicted branched-subunit amino acid permease